MRETNSNVDSSKCIFLFFIFRFFKRETLFACRSSMLSITCHTGRDRAEWRDEELLKTNTSAAREFVSGEEGLPAVNFSVLFEERTYNTKVVLIHSWINGSLPFVAPSE